MHESTSGNPNELRRVGIEFRKFYSRRLDNGFLNTYLSGPHILDIGYQGGDPGAVPITDTAIGVGLDYPGYDGTRLPFADGSQDAILASHVLEHIGNSREVLADWYRVLRIGGYLVLFVPHKYLYERRADLPSRWNGDHKRFYTPATLLTELEESLPVNGFRVRHCVDNDEGFDYEREPNEAPVGGYEIEVVIEKIACPRYVDSLEHDSGMRGNLVEIDALVSRAITANLRAGASATGMLDGLPAKLRYVTPWVRVCRHFLWDAAGASGGAPVTEAELRRAVAPVLGRVEVNETFYLGAYPELQVALQRGNIQSATFHWRTHGYFEGRLHQPEDI
jgi:SAM-dependent methyltransferase